jgi:hypothetical protein
MLAIRSSDRKSLKVTFSLQATHYRTPQKNQSVHSQDLRVKQIRTLLDYPVDLIKEWLQFQDVNLPSSLTESKIDELVKMMCLAWADDKCDYPNYAESSYQEQVIYAVANGADELAAISTWMQQLQTAKAGAV